MFYAVYLVDEDKEYIVSNWNEAQSIFKGKKARYKKFKTEKEAKKWLDLGANYEEKNVFKDELDKDAIYFDAGTGRKIGVEVRVTDYTGKSLLYKIMPSRMINEFGNYLVKEGRTNNFGELTGLFIALKYAKKYNVSKIYSDSKLVIDYWSIGRYNKDNLDEDTIDLITRVRCMYDEYELNGGKLLKISGDINPSDLGFHK